ncbi:hypothetical protein ZWY2020_021024 [Hordeum vulgare]|nr:hypothetical protein ZWY2020_021024 [Hordeum vulgare]
MASEGRSSIGPAHLAVNAVGSRSEAVALGTTGARAMRGERGSVGAQHGSGGRQRGGQDRLRTHGWGPPTRTRRDPARDGADGAPQEASSGQLGAVDLPTESGRWRRGKTASSEARLGARGAGSDDSRRRGSGWRGRSRWRTSNQASTRSYVNSLTFPQVPGWLTLPAPRRRPLTAPARHRRRSWRSNRPALLPPHSLILSLSLFLLLSPSHRRRQHHCCCLKLKMSFCKEEKSSDEDICMVSMDQQLFETLDTVVDPSFCGSFPESEPTCMMHHQKPKKMVAFEGSLTRRRFLGCPVQQDEGVNYGVVEWVDAPWT